MERWRTLITALNDHAVSIAQLRMAGLAINVVALLSPSQRCGNCFLVGAAWQFIAIGIAMLAGKEIAVGIQLLLVHVLVIQLRDGTRHGIARRSAIGIELA